MMAMHRGMHVYVRTMSHTVWEARQMTLLARNKGLCTQMGNQGTATDGIREGAEFVRTGGLGDVKEIHAWTNRPVWPQAPHIVSRPKRLCQCPVILIGIHLLDQLREAL